MSTIFRTKIIALTIVVLFGSGAFFNLQAQCVDHPEGRMIFPPKTISPPLEVEPGVHLLRAMAIIDGRPEWVSVENEIPRGQVCTWTVEDAPPAE